MRFPGSRLPAESAAAVPGNRRNSELNPGSPTQSTPDYVGDPYRPQPILRSLHLQRSSKLSAVARDVCHSHTQTEGQLHCYEHRQ